jgi:hypothetical protein
MSSLGALESSKLIPRPKEDCSRCVVFIACKGASWEPEVRVCKPQQLEVVVLSQVLHL